MNDMIRLMYARYTTEFLKELMAIWPDPKTGKPGISPSALAVECGFKSRQSVYNFLQGTEPSQSARMALGKFFKVVRFADDESINNDDVLKNVKAFLQTYVYGNALDLDKSNQDTTS